MSNILQSLAVILLPVAIPFVKRQYVALQQYRSVPGRPYTASEIQRLQIIAFTSLFYVVIILRTLFFQDKSVYEQTGSRLATPLDVIRRRLASNNEVSAVKYEGLWTMLESPQGILMYLRFGAAPLLECKWCDLHNTSTYLCFAAGGILLKYLGHLVVMSLCTDSRTLPTTAMALMFSFEIYARAGGFDSNNSRSKSTDDIWFIDYLAVLFRQCFFLWTSALLSIECYLDARFPKPQSDINVIRKDLIEAIEKLRASNSMQRSIGEQDTFRNESKVFWARNEASRRSLELAPAVIEAQASARERQNMDAEEKIRTRDFIMQTAWKSLP